MKHKNQVTLLMITDNKNNYHYLALKSIPTGNGYMKPAKSISKLFRDISSKHKSDVYCLNCLYSFRTNKKLKNHQCLCNDHDYCNVVMPEEGKNIFQHYSGSKSLEMPHIIYAGTKTLQINQSSCCNSPEKCYTEKLTKHEACGYAMTVVKLYDSNVHSFYRGEDGLTTLCNELIDNTEKIACTPKKTLIPLTEDEEKARERSEKCHICDGTFSANEESRHYINYRKVIDHDHYTEKYRRAADSICNLRYETQQDIPVVLHNGCNYDFHILIKELAKTLRKNMKCLGENTEKYLPFFSTYAYNK